MPEIFILSELRFNVNPDKHTVRYAENCKQLEFGREHDNYLAKLSLYDAVIADNEEEAVKKISVIINEVLKNCWVKPNLSDFSFRMNKSTLKGDRFCITPGITSGKFYQVITD